MGNKVNNVSNDEEFKQNDLERVEMVALGVFANYQMILKILFTPEYKDFKQECLSFLQQAEQDDNQQIRHYNNDSQQYTMFYHTICDKTLVFVTKCHLQNKLSTIQLLQQTVKNIISTLFTDKSDAYFISMTHLFRSMDSNGHSTINKNEFKNGLNALGIKWKDTKIDKIFKQITGNANSELSCDTLIRFMMTHSNKSSCKQLKSAINSAITVPTPKTLRESNISIELYHKKISQIQKLVYLMEEYVIEQTLASNVRLYWKNQIAAHNEFICVYQSMISKVLIRECDTLKKRVNIDTYTLIERLKKDKKKYKKKTIDLEIELKKLKEISWDGNHEMKDVEIDEMIRKLKVENYALRHERNENNELRKERDVLNMQLNAANNKIRKLELLAGDDTELLKQLAKARAGVHGCRRKRNLREEKKEMKLMGISKALRRKLIAVTKRVGQYDMGSCKRIREKDTANGMIDELASQIIYFMDISDELGPERKKFKKLKRRLMNQKIRPVMCYWIRIHLNDKIVKLFPKELIELVLCMVYIDMSCEELV
eukprot:8967_1